MLPGMNSRLITCLSSTGLGVALALATAAPLQAAANDRDLRGKLRETEKELDHVRDNLHEAMKELAEQKEKVEDLEKALREEKERSRRSDRERAEREKREDREKKDSRKENAKTAAKPESKSVAKTEPKPEPKESPKVAPAKKAQPAPRLFSFTCGEKQGADLEGREAALTWLRAQLERDPALRVRITGHANDSEYPVTNQTIADNRARFLADYLALSGIPRQVLAEVKGEVSGQKGEAGRRVLLEVVGKGPKD